MQLETQNQNPPPIPPPTFADIDLTPTAVIRTETVLSKLPIHNLSKKGRVNIQITRRNAQGQIDLNWEVSYSDRYGQARQLAYKLDTIVVDQKIEEVGRPLPDRICLGSLNQIAQELGLAADHGTTNKHLKRAFRQNALLGITAKFKYKGNDGTERSIEATFTRYSVIFTGEKFSDGTKADAVYITLNPDFREVLNNAPVRPLSLDYKKQLTPSAQRFYEVVSYKMFTALKYNHPLAKLAYSEYCTSSTQQRYFDYDHFKKQMYKVHKPHLDSGYISKISYDATTDEAGQPDWMMGYVPGPKARGEYATFTGKKISSRAGNDQAAPAGERGVDFPSHRRPRQKSLPLRPVVDEQLLAALTSRGVSENQARKTLADLPADFPTLDTIEWADQQIAAQADKFTNPPGFYISLLRDRSTPSATFESSRQKSARLEAELAAQRRIDEAKAREEQKARLARQKIESRLAALTPEQHAALRIKIIAQLKLRFPNMDFTRGTAIHEGAIRAAMLHELELQQMDLLVIPQPDEEHDN